MNAHPVSGTIICLDEVRSIEVAVRSLLKHVDDCVVVDTGSTDGTWQLLNQLQHADSRLRPVQKLQGVPRLSWIEDETRNYASSLCHHDWVLVLDGDEVLDDLPENYFRERDTFASFGSVNLLNHKEMILGLKQYPHPWYPDAHIRFYNKAISRWKGRLHSRIFLNNGHILIDPVYPPKIDIWHYHGLVKADRQWDNPTMREQLILQPIPKPEPELGKIIQQLIL